MYTTAAAQSRQFYKLAVALWYSSHLRRADRVRTPAETYLSQDAVVEDGENIGQVTP
jgi:hypothetical protein